MDDYHGQEGHRTRSQKSALLLLILGGMLAGFLILASPTLGGWLHFIAAHPMPTATPRSLLPITHPTALPTPSPSASATSASYTMFGFNPEHTNDDTDETQLSPSTVSHLTLAWSYHIGGPLQGAPIISDGNVSIAAQNFVVLHVTDGSLSWSTTGANGGGQNSPAIVNGIIYFVPSGGGVLYALSTTTRAELWAVSAGSSIFSSPTVADGTVYVGANDGYLYAFDAKTGAHRWTARTNSGTATYSSSSSPAVAYGMVYIGSTDHTLYAFNAATGTPVWSFSTGSMILSSPSVMDGLVYIGSSDGTLYALRATTGMSVWTFPTSAGFGNLAALANGMIYASSGSHLYALNAATGRLIWTTALSLGSFMNGAPVIANGVIYAGSTDGNLYAFTTTTGTKLWSYPIGTSVNSSPTIAAGMVFASADNGRVYAFRLRRGAD